MHREMHHLLGSWSIVFPLSVLKKIESGLQFSSSANHQSLGLPPLRASESPRSGHGIHINPKYSEAKRQFGHEIAGSSSQPPREVSTVSKIYTQLRHPAAVRFNNGFDIDRIRALIDAYGTDKRTERINGIPAISWKNSDEEEFDWENMSPTLADQGRKDVISSSLPPSGSFRNTAPLQSHLRQDWPNRKQFPAVNGSPGVDVTHSTNGLKNIIYGIRNIHTHFQGSSNPPEIWESVQNVNVSSTQQFNACGNHPGVPFRGSVVLQPPGEQKPSSTGYSTDLNAQNQGSPFGSRGDSVSLEYVKPDQWIAPAGAWRSSHLHSSHTGPMLQTYQPERPIRGQLDNLNGNNLLVKPERPIRRQLDNLNGNNLLVNQDLHSSSFSEHSLPQDMRHHITPASFMGPSPLLAHQFQRGYAPGHMASVGTMVPSPYTQSPLPTRLHGSPLPLPHGFSGSSHTCPISQPSSGAPNRPPLGNLFSSSMAQGVISLNQTAAKEDLVGLEFNPDLLAGNPRSPV